MARPKKLRSPKSHSRQWGDGSVRQVRPGVWRAFRARVHRPDGSTLRPSRTFQGADAETLAAQWAKGEPEHAVLLLGVWLSRWLALRRASLDPSTYDHYRRDVLECAPLAGQPMRSVQRSGTETSFPDWSRLPRKPIATLALAWYDCLTNSGGASTMNAQIEITGTYSDFSKVGGGIGYRLDLSNGKSYTTNPDGSGLFYHNGRGDRQQIAGNSQFVARSMRSFKTKTARFIEAANA